MGIAIKKTHTKFEDLIFKIGKVPAILRFDQFYKGNCLKMTIFAIMGVMAHTNYGHNVDLYGCHWKIWPKCRSPVKTVLKKIHPMEFYGQNKKMCKKMAIFRQFLLYFCPKLQTGGHRPRKVEKS